MQMPAVNLRLKPRPFPGRADTTPGYGNGPVFHAIRVMRSARQEWTVVLRRTCMGETARFQETLRRLAMIDEGFVEDQAGLGLCPPGISALDAKTAALLQVGVSVAVGSPPMCLEWSTGRALAAGAREEEIADVLLAIAAVAGSVGSLPPPLMWRPRSSTTSTPRFPALVYAFPRTGVQPLRAAYQRLIAHVGSHRGGDRRWRHRHAAARR
jgi:alkylhydroperoxidase/carboxymuconolactone decarboxylase family protein YurZ